MSTQHYQVTARKYRPQVFGELVCQEHVTETLKNAIRLDRLAHAYLFSGPRGVGKTTAARVLAKAINCTTPLEDRVDGAEPCRTCDSCRSFEEGRSLSILELDAASNNKVDDVRELRDTVRIPPQGTRKKVYIVDEVHMLSAQAFNAFLKTLEEPPPYALFIFATTEPHKVLPTILSRCQRFDFRRIPVAEIVAHLKSICEAEGVTADEASLLLIARKGDGALRDALSAFDQAVSLCGMSLRYAELASALRVVDVDLYFRLIDAVIASDSASVLRFVEDIVQGGYDLQEFLSGVGEHVRNVLVARTMPDLELIEAVEATRQRYGEFARSLNEPDLLRMLTIVDEAERSLRFSAQPRLKVELTLLKLAALPGAVDLREVVRKIEALENRQRAGTGSAASPSESSSRSSAPAARSTGSQTRSSGAAPRSVGSPATGSASAAAASSASKAPTTVRAPATPQPAAASRPASTSDTSLPLPSSAMDLATPGPAASRPSNVHDLSSAGSRREDQGAPPLFGPPALRARTEGRRQGPSGDSSASRAMFAGSGALAAAPDPVDEQVIPEAPGVAADAWEHAVEQIHADKIHVGALMRHCKPADLRNERLTIAVPDDFHKRMLGTQDQYLLTVLREAMSVSVAQLRFVIDERLSAEDEDAKGSSIDRAEYFNRKRQENPVINAIFEQFGGEIVW